ncbi:hypothetical protein VCR15J2_390054 [Vibrio coralliirubri]|nr:hypothetical protein VCR15J2_390054 [Vibrio coralliirubri]
MARYFLPWPEEVNLLTVVDYSGVPLTDTGLPIRIFYDLLTLELKRPR